MSDRLTVFIIDDEPAVVDSLCALLAGEGFQVAGFRSATEFLRSYSPRMRGCVVADVRMPEISGFQLQEELKTLQSTLPLVMITASADVSMSVRALKRGAVNLLEKPFRPEDIVEAVREALQIAEAAPVQDSAKAQFAQLLGELTDEERAVLDGIVTGQTNAQIARRLDVSLRTMQFRRAEMMRKLGVASKQQLMNLVFAAGWAPQ